MDRGVPPHPSITRIMNGRVFLHNHLESGWDAFWICHKSRPRMFGTGKIPLAELAAYAGMFGYEPGSLEMEELVWTVQILDAEYLKIEADQHEAEEARKKAEAANGRNRTSGKR